MIKNNKIIFYQKKIIKNLINILRKKRKKTKGVVEGSSQQKKPKKDEEFTCYFCKKSGHMKKECPKYATWRVKKGKSLALVCSKVNLVYLKIRGG